MTAMAEEERLGAFEEALASLVEDCESTDRTLEELRAAGKAKTATYRQLTAHKMALRTSLRPFQERGLL